MQWIRSSSYLYTPTLQTHIYTRRPWMFLYNMWTLTESTGHHSIDIIFLWSTQKWDWSGMVTTFGSSSLRTSFQHTHTGVHSQICLNLLYFCIRLYFMPGWKKCRSSVLGQVTSTDLKRVGKNSRFWYPCCSFCPFLHRSTSAMRWEGYST